MVERRRELDKLEIRFDCITFYTGINRSLNNLNAGEWFFMQIEWLIDGPLALEFQSSFLLGFISIFFGEVFFPALPIREPFLCFSFISLEGDADL